MNKQEANNLRTEILQRTGVADILKIPDYDNYGRLSARTKTEMNNKAEEIALKFAQSFSVSPKYDYYADYPTYNWYRNKLSDLEDYIGTASADDSLELYEQLHTGLLNVLFDKAIRFWSSTNNVDAFDYVYNLKEILTGIRNKATFLQAEKLAKYQAEALLLPERMRSVSPTPEPTSNATIINEPQQVGKPQPLPADEKPSKEEPKQKRLAGRPKGQPRKSFENYIINHSMRPLQNYTVFPANLAVTRSSQDVDQIINYPDKKYPF